MLLFLNVKDDFVDGRTTDLLGRRSHQTQEVVKVESSTIRAVSGYYQIGTGKESLEKERARNKELTFSEEWHFSISFYFACQEVY
jgi:hypothetical protein